MRTLPPESAVVEAWASQLTETSPMFKVSSTRRFTATPEGGFKTSYKVRLKTLKVLTAQGLKDIVTGFRQGL